MSSSYPHITGWADYADDYYDGSTAAKTFTIASGTDYELPINAQAGPKTQLPNGGITSLFTPTTLAYDNESGTFTEGLVITGGTSGATGRITHLEDNGTDGILSLAELTGTFVNNEAISDTSTGSALVNGTLTQGGIEGRDGDAIMFTLEFDATPIGGGAASYVEQWIDIGGSVGELYRRTTSFPKGVGVARSVATSTMAYTLSTWEANRGIIYISADGDCEITNARIVIAPIHRSRT